MSRKEPKTTPVKVGISSCLLGQKVRYDGGHKHDRFITDILGGCFQFVPVCPEVDVGMGTPREAVRLEGSVAAPSMIGDQSGTDWTARMNTYSQKRVGRRDLSPISGFILKKDSPSCGMDRVKVYPPRGMPEKKGRGLFAAALMDHRPLLPVEEEGRLNDARLRENFIVRVFACHRLQMLFRGKFSRSGLVRFHRVHKYLLLAHSPKHYRELGVMVADVKKHEAAPFLQKYAELFMAALAVKTTARKNINVLIHILGFLKEHLAPRQKQSILGAIESYRNGLVPLVVPVTLLRHYVDLLGAKNIADQLYLNPHPEEMILRNHV